LKTLPNVVIEKPQIESKTSSNDAAAEGRPIEVHMKDRLGRRVSVKLRSTDTIGTLKKLAATKLGTRWEKMRLQKWNVVYKDHIRLEDYEISDGTNLELYYQ